MLLFTHHKFSGYIQIDSAGLGRWHILSMSRQLYKPAGYPNSNNYIRMTDTALTAVIAIITLMSNTDTGSTSKRRSADCTPQVLTEHVNRLVRATSKQNWSEVHITDISSLVQKYIERLRDCSSYNIAYQKLGDRTTALKDMWHKHNYAIANSWRHQGNVIIANM